MRCGGVETCAVERLSALAWISIPRDHLHPLSSRHTVSTSNSTPLDRIYPPLPPLPYSIPFPVPKHLIGAPCPHSSQARSVVWHVASDWRFTTRGAGLLVAWLIAWHLRARVHHALAKGLRTEGLQAKLACKPRLTVEVNSSG